MFWSVLTSRSRFNLYSDYQELCIKMEIKETELERGEHANVGRNGASTMQHQEDSPLSPSPSVPRASAENRGPLTGAGAAGSMAEPCTGPPRGLTGGRGHQTQRASLGKEAGKRNVDQTRSCLLGRARQGIKDNKANCAGLGGLRGRCCRLDKDRPLCLVCFYLAGFK